MRWSTGESVKTFLDDILKVKRAEVSSMAPMDFERLMGARAPRSFIGALRTPPISIIAEIKPKSPSHGSFHHAKDPISLALRYQKAGASAISVLADRQFFNGSPELVKQVANNPCLHLPVLYKDFIIDHRQIYEARLCGADAVLLIARAIGRDLLQEFIRFTHALKMQALVETFDEEDVASALSAGSSIIGINNRDLQTFAVDLHRSMRLAQKIFGNIFKVSESGISSRADVLQVERAGFHAILAGEALLDSHDPGDKLMELLGRPRSEMTAGGSNRS
jgi:indole-3-glycerol phosphate synthase